MNRDRASIEAAAAYLREMIEAGADDYRTKSVYEGLLDVLDPSRYSMRVQRAAAADAAVAILRGTRDRRGPLERRGHSDRRLVNFGPAANGERRMSADRRTGDERRRG